MIRSSSSSARWRDLPGAAVAACGVVGDQLGEMLQQVGLTADAVLGQRYEPMTSDQPLSV